ncbi:STAS/SEC14 domain-containing protein [Chondromyces apiculatus]|uniref:STAS/SEC14 domain-containing protein n=1 Tax=Chondromyces apiculatus DSM 436 TaxID=1192034 RepID=A0A017T5A4_9BACT|nr:STAS/SEC14 domain-containing protein [Chondromyces apiculatus]EYF03741.1 Hypothetical protein CAP_5171 [Chondromyces apiculatus DSM 436]
MMNEHRRPCGAHLVVFEAPDLLVVRFSGVISIDDMQRIVLAAEELTGSQEYRVLYDATYSGSIAPEVRRWMATIKPSPWFRGAVTFGLAFPQRLVASMLMKAIARLKPHKQPLHICATEDEARAWIDGERRHDVQTEASL